MPRHRKLASLLALCPIAASVVLAACGGSSPTATAGTSSAAQSEDQVVKFTKCLREHGINASNGAGGVIKASGGNPQQFEAAQNACKSFQPKGQDQNLSPAEREQRQEGALKFARCMRSHGIDVPDPTFENGRIGIKIKNGAGGPDPASPTFQAAQSSCGHLLGKDAPKLGAGPAGSTSSAGGPSNGSGFQAQLRVGG